MLGVKCRQRPLELISKGDSQFWSDLTALAFYADTEAMQMHLDEISCPRRPRALTLCYYSSTAGPQRKF